TLTLSPAAGARGPEVSSPSHLAGFVRTIEAVLTLYASGWRLMNGFDLSRHGISANTILRNVSPSSLYEEAIRYDKGTTLSDTGCLIAYSGDKTGRSPQDKRVVQHKDTEKDIWWGPVNFPQDETTFMINRERAKDYL